MNNDNNIELLTNYRSLLLTLSKLSEYNCNNLIVQEMIDQIKNLGIVVSNLIVY